MALKFAIYYCLLFFTACLSATYFRRLAFPDKLIGVLVLATFFNELLSFFADKIYHNNLPLYHIFCPIELLLISLYFSYSVRVLRIIAVVVGLLGVPLSILNCWLFQPLKTINSNFLLFEATAIILYSFTSFRQILLEEERLPYDFAQFWISTGFAIFWGATFTGWGLYTVIDPDEFLINPIFGNVLIAVNYLLYLGISYVFLRYKKLIPSGG